MSEIRKDFQKAITKSTSSNGSEVIENNKVHGLTEKIQSGIVRERVELFQNLQNQNPKVASQIPQLRPQSPVKEKCVELKAESLNEKKTNLTEASDPSTLPLSEKVNYFNHLNQVPTQPCVSSLHPAVNLLHMPHSGKTAVTINSGTRKEIVFKPSKNSNPTETSISQADSTIIPNNERIQLQPCNCLKKCSIPSNINDSNKFRKGNIEPKAELLEDKDLSPTKLNNSLGRRKCWLKCVLEDAQYEKVERFEDIVITSKEYRTALDDFAKIPMTDEEHHTALTDFDKLFGCETGLE